MVNEEIITALKNSVERGESLQTAVNILINSGYNPREIQEASNFIGGTIRVLEPKSEEYLTMPNDKRFPQHNYQQKYTKMQQPFQQTSFNQPLQNFKQKFIQDSTQIKQEISRGLGQEPIQQQSFQFNEQESKQQTPLSEQLNQIYPKRESYTVEIILIIILLILIGVLISTIVFKESLLQFFSKF